MHLPSLFVVLVYVSGYLFLVFSAICLACGLFYLVELAEERTSITKRIIRVISVFMLGIHALLWVYERFPFLPTAVGFVSHVSYMMLLSNFPTVRITSAPFVSSCILFFVDNYMWFSFFHNDPELFYRYRVAPTPAIASFFLLVVWLVPFGFFVSLSVNDAVLPGVGTALSGHNDNLSSPALDPDTRKKNSRNLVLALLDTVCSAVKRGVHAVPLPSISTRNDDILSSSVNRRLY
jgi:hypothetical protein